VQVDIKARRVPLKGGREYDAFTPWRYWLYWQAGELKGIKRRYNRRVRAGVRRELANLRRR
jgi:hypothetical protein